jgi:dCTP deaminase
MLLSDRTIVSRIADPGRWEQWQMLLVKPLYTDAVQPCSVDVHLAGPMRIYSGATTDTRRDNSPWWQVLPETINLDRGVAEASWILQPDRFYLAVLDEWIVVPEDLCGHLHGVSSRARDGISVHQTAGLLDPGWRGRATLEITVANPHTVVYPGQRIAQVTFELLDERCRSPYAGRYQDDLTATPARSEPEAGVVVWRRGC